MPLKIDQMFAFIAVDEKGDEGVVGMRAPNGEWAPFVGADEARANSLKPYAEEIATVSGREVKLVRFTTRAEIQTITPKRN